MQAPTSEGGEIPNDTKLQLLITSPGGFAPLKSDPTEWTAAAGGSCTFAFSRAFRQAATLEALRALVQPGSVRLSVHEAGGSGAPLAHADLDMAALALGSGAWEATGLELVPVEAVGPGSTVKVGTRHTVYRVPAWIWIWI